MTVLQDIIYVFFLIIMVVIMLICIKKISKRNIELSFNKVLISILLCQAIIINNYYNTPYLILITTITLSVLINKMIFNMSLKESIKYTLIFYIVGITTELVITLLLINTNITNLAILNNEIVIKTVLSIVQDIAILLAFNSKWILKLIKKLEIIISSSIKILYILFFTIFALNIVTILRNSGLNNKVIIILTVLFLVCIIVILNVLINDKYIIKVLTDRNNNLKESFRAYKETIDGYRVMKHNLKNELYSIKTMLPYKYQKEIDKLIIKNNNDTKWIAEIGEIPEGLQGIFYLKKKEAEKKKVTFIIDAKNYNNIIDNDYIDLCDTVGILVDNAVEASSNTKKRLVDIVIKEDSKKLSIVIKNIFNNSIDLNKIGKKNYSTKQIKSGIGLFYLNHLKNENIRVNYKIINNIFITEIDYFLKKKNS